MLCNTGATMKRGDARFVAPSQVRPSPSRVHPLKLVRAVIVGILLALVLPLLVACDAEKTESLTAMNKGVASYREGSYGSSVEHLKAATASWPENHRAHFMLGQIYQFKYTQPEEAVAHYARATQYNADNAEYWYHQGACLSELKRDDEARTALEKAVSLDAKYADAFYRLGVIAERNGEPRKAADLYGSSIRLDARKPYAYYNLGDLYFRNNKFEEARQVFKNGTQNNPEHAELRHGLGLTYLSMARHREALLEFEESLKLKRPYPSATYNVAMTYLALDEKKKAGEHLEKFLAVARTENNSARIAAAEAQLLKLLEANK